MAAAAAAADNDEKKLQDIFLQGWNSYEAVEESTLPFNSTEFQNQVLQAMEHFETATRLVSEISIFSDNELLDELPTESLQFMLLPFFLGKLALKLNRSDRAEVLRVAQIYFKDYLQRCEQYELCEASANSAAIATVTANADPMTLLLQSAQARNDKIAQFRAKKQLEEYLQQLKVAVKSNAIDDEVKREFFIKMIKKCVIDGREELQSIHLEEKMLQMRQVHMTTTNVATTSAAALPQNNNKQHSADHHAHHAHHKQQTGSQSKPLQPFIITRNAAQKAVYGLGYPSLPVMSVNEFYEQRVDEGIFPNEEKMAKINREKAIRMLENPEIKEEEDKEALDKQIDEDDPEYLARMRRRDEHRDVVRRGDGNRHNRS